MEFETELRKPIDLPWTGKSPTARRRAADESVSLFEQRQQAARI